MTENNKRDPALQEDLVPAVEEGLSADAQKELEAIMLKYDRESAYRRLSDFRGRIISIVAIVFAIIQLYHTFNPLPYIRPLHVGLVMLLAYLLYPAKKTMRKDTIPWYDIVLALVAFGVCMYQVVNLRALNARLRLVDYQYVLAIIGIVLLLEATRRVVGLPIVIIASLFILIAVFGQYMPGFLKSNNSWKRIVAHLWYDQEGIFGAAIGACTTFIFLFMLFGAFLEKTGVGEFFIDLANALAGHTRGGPAKVAVISSALMGTVSGSSVANTVGTGSFTIPMMKKIGYRPQFAGAVEAAASTGGQIMPPVMGAAAFLMVDSVGLPYGEIVKAGVIPAILYFSGVFLIVDLESKKHSLLGMPRDQMPRLNKIMSERGHLMLPLALIIFVLVGTSLTPAYAALIGIAAAAAVGYIKTLFDLLVPGKKDIGAIMAQRTGLKGRDYFGCLESGARGVLSVALACGTSGIVSGIITVTGIGARIGDGFTQLAGGNLLLLLFFTMITSIILGMGVPTTANYIITSSVMAPVVIRAMAISLPQVVEHLSGLGGGYVNLPAHMFTFYFGIVADITPPVCLAAMAGAAIAKAEPIKTGFEATRLAIAAFIIPYMFIFSPELLMVGAPWFEILRVMIGALIGMFGIAMGLQRFYLKKLNILQQVMALAGGLMLIETALLTDIIGLSLIGLVVLWQRIETKGKIIPVDTPEVLAQRTR
ncbi:MAG: TRAP transporter permease [Eubacteriales bacterium]|nr:TRAP transporter permease [Eubacteriales bacterium]